MLSFTDRMAEGREIAQIARNRGQHTGKSAKGWNRPLRCDFDPTSWAWLCEQQRREWRKECLRLQNDFAAACLNGPGWEEDLKWLQ